MEANRKINREDTLFCCTHHAGYGPVKNKSPNKNPVRFQECRMTYKRSNQVLSSLRIFLGFFTRVGIMVLFPFTASSNDDLRISVVYNNVAFSDEMELDWGFSCVVRSPDRTILFDTGGEGRILLKNMAKLGLDPLEIEAVFLSHKHGDHIGGVTDFLSQNPKVAVYVPKSFSSTLHERIKNPYTKIIPVGGPIRLYENVYSTGEMGTWLKEQSLVLDTFKGAVVITGCAHPGILDIVKKARQLVHKDICLVMGGFHLLNKNASEIDAIIRALKEMGVQKIAPSHCTGEQAVLRFKKAWGENFIAGGCGAQFSP
jgi:7,8-dihydropterin-6-yl-methyl-4-(beta-D-ribofuranosyl)aminobenzene 5'-phosphate synthase